LTLNLPRRVAGPTAAPSTTTVLRSGHLVAAIRWRKTTRSLALVSEKPLLGNYFVGRETTIKDNILLVPQPGFELTEVHDTPFF
jgi:hypothetical protein